MAEKEKSMLGQKEFFYFYIESYFRVSTARSQKKFEICHISIFGFPYVTKTMEG
jgi:hypothetical protein